MSGSPPNWTSRVSLESDATVALICPRYSVEQKTTTWSVVQVHFTAGFPHTSKRDYHAPRTDTTAWWTKQSTTTANVSRTTQQYPGAARCDTAGFLAWIISTPDNLETPDSPSAATRLWTSARPDSISGRWTAIPAIDRWRFRAAPDRNAPCGATS